MVEKNPVDKKDSSDTKKFDFSRYWKHLIVFLIVFLVVILIIMFSSNDEEVPVSGELYNGFVFFQTSDGLWRTEMKTVYGDRNVWFRHHPLELEDYYFNKSVFKYIENTYDANGFFFISLTPDVDSNMTAGIAGMEIAKVISKIVGFGDRTKSALTERDPDTPSNVAACKDASEKAFVLEIDIGNETGMYVEPYCTRLVGKDFDEIIKLADMFAYHVTGVMS